ncbi:hypothetical protein [Bacillus paranthracis]|uniref:hypothetical protein n=1 Tax=Bacillus paranthracis TaxID=2026186 RepID=UPI000AAACC93|nr:hypothetical protein [Bacillus paranthracis]
MSDKKKKTSVDTLAKQAVEKLYKEQYDTIPIISSCNYPKIGTGYAAVTNKQIEIFKYDKSKQKISTLNTYILNDYQHVTADHYALKTVFNFDTGTRSPFVFIPVENGKQIESLFRTQTHLTVTSLRRKWYKKILGFRSGKAWKMVVACFFYFMFFGTIFNLVTGNGNTAKENTSSQTASADIEKQKEKERKEAIEKVQKEEKEKAAEEKKKQEKEVTTTAPPVEKKEESLEEKVKKVVSKKFGEKKVESVQINDNLGTEDPDDKIVLITAEGKENLTNNMTKKGMWMDTKDMLKDFTKEKEISEIAFFYKYPMVDVYGNKKNDTIMKLTFDRATLDKINFDNFLTDNVPKIAKDYWQHPAIDKK